jgi:hypothetical protein
MIQSIYVAGGLTEISPDYKILLESVVIALEPLRSVNRFFSLQIKIEPSIDGQNRYLFNENQVLKSNALVAFCDYPSTGVGMEIMIAHISGKKIVILHKMKSQLSKMFMEFAESFKYPVLLYSNSEPVTDIVKRFLAELDK